MDKTSVFCEYIAENILPPIFQDKDSSSISLFTGISGRLLPPYYAGKYFNKQTDWQKHIGELSGKVFDNVGTVTSSSFAEGLAGIGWIFEHLKQQSFIEADTNILLEDIDEVLQASMEYEFQVGHWDFLRGGLGILFYYQERSRSNKSLLPILQKGITLLENIGEKQGDIIKWSSTLGNTNNRVYNISLSHGMASIVAMLAGLYHTEGLDREKISGLLHGVVGYILQQENDTTKYGSYFPNYSLESQGKMSKSNMAWCYGDLGIAVSLWRAGESTGNEFWKNKALEILLFTAENRCNLSDESVRDAGLCHGASGIGHIFYRMWWNTRMPEFKNAADYWFGETLKMAQFHDGLAGFKTWSPSKNEWYNNYDFLEGVTGIGTALLTYSCEVEPTWDRCMLLS